MRERYTLIETSNQETIACELEGADGVKEFQNVTHVMMDDGSDDDGHQHRKDFQSEHPGRFIRGVKGCLEVLSNTYRLPVDRMTDQGIYANVSKCMELQLQTNQ